MKSRVELNEQVQKELNKQLNTISKIVIIVSAVLLAIYIAVSVFVENIFVELIFYIALAGIGFGVFILVYTSMLKKQTLKQNIINEIEFFNDFFEVTSYKEGVQIGLSKIFYKDLKKIKNTENYIFLYTNNLQAFPISKKDINMAEITNIIKIQQKN